MDAGQIVDGQAWASRRSDGRHYHPIVPLEVFALLSALVSPPPPPLIPTGEAMAKDDVVGLGPHLNSLGVDCRQP